MPGASKVRRKAPGNREGDEMSTESTDEGVSQVVLENFTKHELPRLLQTMEKLLG